MSVLNWDTGPLRVVQQEILKINELLPKTDATPPQLDFRGGAKRYSELFKKIYETTRRRPLLLLDQFDDYQAQPRHRERFLPNTTRVWQDAEAIAHQNSFWRVIKQCLADDSVKVIVACRRDAVAGLDSLRFFLRDTRI